jgi:nitrite reductase/ring-hydroxylating ferredoxin subunit
VAAFIEVAALAQLPPGTKLVVMVGGVEVALFNIDGVVYAVDNSCMHAGGSLAAGALEGKVVTCRGHGWQYDVTTGKVIGIPEMGVDTYQVTIAGGKIRITVP